MTSTRTSSLFLYEKDITARVCCFILLLYNVVDGITYHVFETLYIILSSSPSNRRATLLKVLALYFPASEPMDLMQNYCFLIRAHLGGWGGRQFSKQRCSLESVNNSVQISSPQLLLSEKYSRLKLPFYNRFPMGDTHVGILGYSLPLPKLQSGKTAPNTQLYAASNGVCELMILVGGGYAVVEMLGQSVTYYVLKCKLDIWNVHWIVGHWIVGVQDNLLPICPAPTYVLLVSSLIFQQVTLSEFHHSNAP